MSKEARGAKSTEQFRFTVVVPTYQRRTTVVRCIRSLAQQDFDGRFEVIVVVDGSTDNSAETVRALAMPFPLRVFEQPNQGAASARNQGAVLGTGEILLFLDDDMEADRQLLSEHDRSHREGADAVLGHMPLHPEAPKNLLTVGVKRWSERRLDRLSTPGAPLTLHDLLTGQLSVRREAFQDVGGFSLDFTQGGSFGNEDVDFGYRLILKGYRVIFNARAISWQNYAVGPRQYLRQWRQAGHADVLFARKHPEHRKTLFLLNGASRRSNRWLWRPAVAVPWLSAPLTRTLRLAALWMYNGNGNSGRTSDLATRLFFHARSVEYWKGVREAGGIPHAGTVRILSYHSLQDLTGHAVVEPYGIPVDRFCKQILSLIRAGYHFISPEEFLRFQRHSGVVPKKAILLTFDDCYEDLLEISCFLKDLRIPAIAFAVSSLLGLTNKWDESGEASTLGLLDVEGLRRLEKQGIEIGAHSRTHVNLTELRGDALSREIAGSVSELEQAGLKRPRFFAYPYGSYDERVKEAVRHSGVEAAFTVTSGRAISGSDPYAVPRIELLNSDTHWGFLWKVALAGRSMTSTITASLVRHPFKRVLHA